MIRTLFALSLLVISTVVFSVFAAPSVPSGGGASLSLGALLRDAADPRALGLALLAGAGGWLQLRREHDGLGRAAGIAVRVFLWVTAVANLVVLLRLQLAAPADTVPVALEKVRQVELGGWCAILALAALDLIAHREPPRWVRSLEFASVVTLLLSIAVLLLDVFQRSAAPLDPPAGWTAPGPGVPSLAAIGLGDFFASVALVLLVPWVLRRISGPRPCREAAWSRLPFLLGALGAIAVEVAGLQSLAAGGGQADPSQLNELVGRMAVPALLGALLWALAWRGSRVVDEGQAGSAKGTRTPDQRA